MCKNEFLCILASIRMETNFLAFGQLPSTSNDYRLSLNISYKSASSNACNSASTNCFGWLGNFLDAQIKIAPLNHQNQYSHMEHNPEKLRPVNNKLQLAIFTNENKNVMFLALCISLEGNMKQSMHKAYLFLHFD